MIADALTQSGNQGVQYAAPSGNRAYKHSEWEGVNNILQKVIGAYLGSKADKQAAALDQQDQGQLGDLVKAQRDSQAPDVNGELDPNLQSAEGPTPVPPAAKPLSKMERVAKFREQVLKGQQFGGQSGDLAGKLLEREVLPPVQQPYTLNAGDVRYGADNAPIAAAPQREVRETPEDRMLINVADPAAKDGHRTIKRADWKGEQLWEKPAAASSNGVTNDDGLSADALHNATLDVMRNPDAMGQYVTRAGNAGKKTREDINNGVAAEMKRAGISNNQLAAFRGRVKGEVKSQTTLVEMSNAVQSYEKVARFNGDRLLQLIDKVDATGIPAIEGLVRAAKKSGGNVDTGEFVSVLKTYQTEVARILSQPRLVGQLTDTQIDEMKKVVDSSASAPQMKRVINRLNLEMDMRAGSIEDQIKMSGGQMALPGGGETVPTANPAAPAAAGNDFSGLWK